MHVVKQISSLLSVVAIASCGTMPVPEMGEVSSHKPVEVVDTAPVTRNKSVSNNLPIEAAKTPDLETKQTNEMPDTSYLADVTESKDIQHSKVESPSRVANVDNKTLASNNKPVNSPEVQNTNVEIKNGSEQLDYIVTANGQIKEVPASTQTQRSQDITKTTGTLNQEPDSKKPKKDTNKSVSNRDQEVRIQLALANRYYNSAKYQNAIDLLETPATSSKSNEKLRDLLLLSYTKYAKELVSKANLLEAQTILEKAVSIEPNNTGLQNQLKKIKNTREANRIYQLGLDAVNSGDKISAFKSFQKVLVLNPSHRLAKQQVLKIRGPVIESRYKEAMQHYRKQELTDAIRAWNDVLELDPNHELAKLYRSRAVELKRKIEVIDKQ